MSASAVSTILSQAMSQPLAVIETTALAFAQAANEGSIQESSGNSVWAGLVVAVMFGGALYAICRSSRRG